MAYRTTPQRNIDRYIKRRHPPRHIRLACTCGDVHVFPCMNTHLWSGDKGGVIDVPVALWATTPAPLSTNSITLREGVRGCKRSIFSTNLLNDEYSIHKNQVIVPDRVILSPQDRDFTQSHQIESSPTWVVLFLFQMRKLILKWIPPKLCDLLTINNILCRRRATDARGRWAEDTGVDTEPADASQPYWIQIIIVRPEHQGKPRGRALCVCVFDRLCCRV